MVNDLADRLGCLDRLSQLRNALVGLAFPLRDVDCASGESEGHIAFFSADQDAALRWPPLRGGSIAFAWVWSVDSGLAGSALLTLCRRCFRVALELSGIVARRIDLVPRRVHRAFDGVPRIVLDLV
jgi:hypothetical protein